MIVSSVQAAYFYGIRNATLKEYLDREATAQRRGRINFVLTYTPGPGRGHGYRFDLYDCNTVMGFIPRRQLQALVVDYQRRYGRVLHTATVASWAVSYRRTALREYDVSALDANRRELGLRVSNWRGTITMGADPEFELIRDGEWVSASRYFSGNGQVGTDGAPDTGEIRPRPGTPEQVADNVRACLQRVARTLIHERHPITVHAGAGINRALGGHIHFGTENRDMPQERVRPLLQDRWVTQHLNSLCSRESVSHRESCGYGVMGQIRRQPHGWEYRAAPSWISHPALTRGALTVAFLIASANETPRINRWEDLLELTNDEGRKQAIRDFYSFPERNIERSDVLENWGLRNAQEEIAPPETPYVVAAGAGSNMAEVVDGLRSSRQVTIVGYRDRWSPAHPHYHEAVDFYENRQNIYYSRDMHLSVLNGRTPEVSLQRWDRESGDNTLFVSASLREDPLRCRRLLSDLLQTIAVYDADMVVA